MAPPSMRHWGKRITTDDEAPIGSWDTGNSEAAGSKNLNYTGLGLARDRHDMPVVIRHLLLIRIAKEISSGRHVMGI